MRRRINLRQAEGQAMTEFALSCLCSCSSSSAARLRPRLLLLDRGEPPRERDCPMGRRRPQPRPGQVHRSRGCAAEVRARQRRDARVYRLPRCASPCRPRRDADARGASAGEDLQAVQLPADPQDRDDHDPRHVDDADRALRLTTPGRREYGFGSAVRSLHVSRLRGRARHRPGARRGDDPRLPAARGARDRRRQLVHAQAAAPEPRRRGRLRGRCRVREGLVELRLRRHRSHEARRQGRGSAEDRRRRAPVRGRSGSVRLRQAPPCRRRGSRTPRSRRSRTST